jgi:tryptophanyl-tRNA synthetase
VNFAKIFANFAVKKKRNNGKILHGVQSTGTPHLGNLLGAIIPAIALSNKPENESFLFIADLHSITQIKKRNPTNQYLQHCRSLLGLWLRCK